ncbi:MAG: putative lipid II flippase FtsW [Bdellovibrionales bacterium]|nr:putative lipid II flippase FtsW [Bdellovibrionales bacterium]
MATISKNWLTSFKLFFSKQRGGDVLLIILVMAMVLFGLLMVYSASYIFAEERTGDGYSFIRKQLFYALAGFGALFVTSRIPHQKWYTWAPIALGVVLSMLILVMIPGVGARVGGAQRWINLGLFRFQPAELAKIVGVMFVGRQLVRHQRDLHDFKKGVISPVALLLPLMVLLLFQPDFGSTALLAGTTFILMFIAGVRPLYLFGGLFGGLGAAAMLVITSPYRMARVMTFIDPWRDPAGKGFQVIQSMLGLHNGSLFGQGLGNGKEKLFFLPEAHNDFIFAVIGEELGFIGIAAVICAYIFFIYRGLRISWSALQERHDRFGFYLGCGISLLLGMQAFINMGVVMGLLPTKGLTLPFISYGGSALTLNLMAIGILYSISKANKGAFYEQE